MAYMGPLIKCSLVIILVVYTTAVAVSQIPAPVDNDDFELWNDVNVSIPVNDMLDIYLPFALWLYNNGTSFGEGRAGGGLTFKVNKRLSLATYYQLVRTQNSQGVYRNENRYVVRGGVQFPTKHFGLSHRSQFEFRDRSGNYSWRYRPSITIDRKLPDKYGKGLKVFVKDEPFYDSVPGRFSRNRFSAGITKALNKNVSLDLYYLRQDDSVSQPHVVHVAGASWKIKF